MELYVWLWVRSYSWMQAIFNHVYGGFPLVCSERAVRGVPARRLDLLIYLVWIVLPNLPRLRRCADLPHRPRHGGALRRYRYRCTRERARLAAITFSVLFFYCSLTETSSTAAIPSWGGRTETATSTTTAPATTQTITHACQKI